ncbi:MAG: hypothetical protein ACJAYU_001166 [Bradymonadia bacterium]|jgi:hypothetical protein
MQIAGSSFGEQIEPSQPAGAQSASESQMPNSNAGTAVLSSNRANGSSSRSAAGVATPAETTGGGPKSAQPPSATEKIVVAVM